MKKNLILMCFLGMAVYLTGCEKSYKPSTEWTKTRNISFKEFFSDNIKMYDGLVMEFGEKVTGNLSFNVLARVLSNSERNNNTWTVQIRSGKVDSGGVTLNEEQKKAIDVLNKKIRSAGSQFQVDCEKYIVTQTGILIFPSLDLEAEEPAKVIIKNKITIDERMRRTVLQFACGLKDKEIDAIVPSSASANGTQIQQPAQEQAQQNTQQQDLSNQPNAAEQVRSPSNSNADTQPDATSNASNDWVHVNSRRGNYGNINHAYVLPSSFNNNKIQVKEVIEGGQRNGSHYTYWMEASCSDGMIRMSSNVQQFGANNRFIGENPPSSPGWYKATGQKDPAVWNYICRR